MKRAKHPPMRGANSPFGSRWLLNAARVGMHTLSNPREHLMTFPKLKIALAAAILMAGAQAQAALAVYTSQADFDAAVAAMVPALSGLDSFDDLVAGANLGSGPLAALGRWHRLQRVGRPGERRSLCSRLDVRCSAVDNVPGDSLSFSSFAPVFLPLA